MITFRPGRPADIPFLVALSSRSATAAQWDEAHYRAAFARGNPSERLVLVLEEDSQPQGFLVARPLGPEWELENIAVAAAAGRRGLASRLLREFMDLARNNGAQAIYLEVRESNLPARKLYEKWGFVESGRRPAYYHDPGEAAIVYNFLIGASPSNSYC
jgi:ribosomal-protein-alanine N-acetyltransferase